MEKKTVFRIVFSIFLLMVLYFLGLPLYFVLFFGVFILLMILLRGHVYNKVEHYLRHFFPALKKLNPKIEKIIIILAFIIIYLIIKQGIFLILKYFGVDIEKIMFDSLNN